MARIDDAIIRSAMQRFRHDGYESTPISRIAEDAGVTKVTLYKRYESKSHILAAALDTACSGIDVELAGIRTSTADPIDALEKVLWTMLKRCLDDNHLSIYRVILTTSPADVVVRECLSSWRHRFHGTIRDLIETYLAQQALSHKISATDITAVVVDLMMNGPLNHSVSADHDNLRTIAEAKRMFVIRWPIAHGLITGALFRIADPDAGGCASDTEAH
ncbi:TetR/AcrR family transcriptional regulator [Ochrobactrum sp. S46]|nr:TetR/AcrR family transcriptional regulator [Ochrobactrum sp. S45]MBK0046222.1 TetR/AcrR family transcriptional regulator [Ochrobactrum sp. S46]